jgi:hypothetical protein
MSAVVSHLNYIRSKGVIFYLKEVDKITYIDVSNRLDDDDFAWLRRNKQPVINHLLTENLTRQQLRLVVDCLRKHLKQDDCLTDMCPFDLYDILEYLATNSLCERKDKQDGSDFYDFFTRELRHTENATVKVALDLLVAWIERWK